MFLDQKTPSTWRFLDMYKLSTFPQADSQLVSLRIIIMENFNKSRTFCKKLSTLLKVSAPGR